MFSQIGLTEILIVLGGLFLLFGAKRIPAIGRAIGQGITNLIGEVRGASTAGPQLPPSQEAHKTEDGPLIR
jgi:TatA/E family protein of Tat protein translocase